MKTRLLLISFLLLTGLSKVTLAQQPAISGPSDTLVVLWSSGDPDVAAMQKDGVIVQACVACSNMYGVTDELKVCKVDVRGMGGPLTDYLKRDYKIVSF